LALLKTKGNCKISEQLLKQLSCQKLIDSPLPTKRVEPIGTKYKTEQTSRQKGEQAEVEKFLYLMETSSFQ
jgi:hypothetical protein